MAIRTPRHRPKYDNGGGNSKASQCMSGPFQEFAYPEGRRTAKTRPVTPPTSPQVWQVRRQFKGKYGNSSGNSMAIQGNSDPKMAIQASGGVPKPEKCGNSRPLQFAFIKLNNVYDQKGNAVSTQCGEVSTQWQGSAVSTQCGAVSSNREF